jgi:Tol biopolymer transport system component
MLRAILIFVIIPVIFTACSTSGPNSTQDFARPSATLERPPIRTSLLDGTAAPAPPLAGKFIFAPGDGSIWVQNPPNGKATPVIKPTPELFADAPSWSPDGKTFVYQRSSLTEQGTAQNAIYRANQDGTGNEPIALPPNNKTTLNWPHFSWDGKWVYYTASYPVPPNKQHSEITRIAVGGGEPQKIIEDARMSTESPDGKQIAFIRFNFDTFAGGLWVADIDGQNARPLLNDDVFIMISAPQWSPDGSQILFAASGPNTRPLPGVSMRTPECSPALLCMFAKPAYADGLPWDLWTVTPDGSKFTRLTEIGADSPYPAWSRDSTQVAFFDTSGQYLVDLKNKVLLQITRNGGHGTFGWWQ